MPVPGSVILQFKYCYRIYSFSVLTLVHILVILSCGFCFKFFHLALFYFSFTPFHFVAN